MVTMGMVFPPWTGEWWQPRPAVAARPARCDAVVCRHARLSARPLNHGKACGRTVQGRGPVGVHTDIRP